MCIPTAGAATVESFNVAFMTSGGLAPCLSSAIASLVKHWSEAQKRGEVCGLHFRCYLSGYKGVLLGESIEIPKELWDKIDVLHESGGSPIGNSRVKLTNIKDCVKRGYVTEGECPLEKAAQQLIADRIDVLHTIGGDDTNTQAAELSKYIEEKHGGKVHVIGMPKTIDNDVIPIRQTFGANSAAEQGAIFFENVVSESTSNPRMLILHEVMGRDSGYLTAATAKAYRARLKAKNFLPTFTTNMHSRDIHAIWIPEEPIRIKCCAERLRKVMDEIGCVNVFFSEGCGIDEIIEHMEQEGEEVPRDPFGHVRINELNPGMYFAEKLKKLIGAEKTLVQKSGYFCRSAKSNAFDRDLIDRCAQEGVKSAIAGISGCMGEDETKEGCPVRAIEFERIKGGKTFDVNTPWYQEMLKEVGQCEKNKC